MTTRRRRVVVLGATGFIGRNIATAMAARADIELIAVGHSRPTYDLAGATWRHVDLRDPAAVALALEGADTVIQAAATTSGSKDIVARPYIHVTDNAVMNSYILRSCHDLGVRHLVFFSCSIMYASSDTPQRESDFNAAAPLQPNYFAAGWTKVYIERMCEFFAGLGRTRCTVIRHSNIYGPHDKFDLDRSHVLGATITKVLTAKNDALEVWGTGQEARDFLYIDDLTDFVFRAIDRDGDAFALYNCGSGRLVTIANLVEAVMTASGRRLDVRFNATKPTIPYRVALDCARARNELGWAPAVELSDGLRRTVTWWRDHRPA